MKFENNDLAKFIELVTRENNVVVKSIKKNVVIYRNGNDKRKNIKVNLHTLCVEALANISLKNNVIVKVNKGLCVFKINKFKIESDIKDWCNTIIFIALLKLK